MDRGPLISGRLAPLPTWLHLTGKSQLGEASHGVSVPLDQMLNFPRLPGKLGGHMAQVLTWELREKSGPRALKRGFLPGKKTEPHASFWPRHTVGRQDSGAVAASLQPQGDTLEDRETNTLTLIEHMEGKLGSTMTDLKAFHLQTS